MRMVVVGGDSMIGRSLAISDVGRAETLVTTRALPVGHRLDNLYGLDLARVAREPELAEIFADAAADGSQHIVAYLAAAVTGFQQCQSDPVGSAAINVEAAVLLAQALIRRNAHVVFLSTSAVFSGANERPDEAALCDPETEYGRQKACAEGRLLNLAADKRCAGGIAVVRLTKVIGYRTPIVAQWLRDLGASLPVEAASDLNISPISLDYAVRGLIRIGVGRHTGVFHLSGERDLSWHSFAVLLAGALGRAPETVVPVELAVSGLRVQIPRYSALAMPSTTSRTGLLTQPAGDVVRDLFPEALQT